MAAVMGHARTTPAADDADDKRPLVEVIKEPVVTGDATGRGGGTLLPEVGDGVLRGTPHQPSAGVVRDRRGEWQGGERRLGVPRDRRQQDVRATED